jgi:hypothetical protein
VEGSTNVVEEAMKQKVVAEQKNIFKNNGQVFQI